MKHDSRWATAVNEASELYQRIDDLEKELAKANERADTNHESFVKIFAASRSKDAIIAGLNQKVVSVNERAVQAEADARAIMLALSEMRADFNGTWTLVAHNKLLGLFKAYGDKYFYEKQEKV